MWRVAVYFAPAMDDVLARLGAAWLGWDADSGAVCAQPAWPGMAEITAEARAYGFHATLKPPMRLAEGYVWDDVRRATQDLAARIAPFDLPPLAVAELQGFLALREQAPCPALQALADLCVAALDRFRAPPMPDETGRRLRGRLTDAQKLMLARWGYPYVFGEWFFHMTLTRRLSGAERDYWRPVAEAFFAPALSVPRRVTEICLFTQMTPDEPFTVAARVKLRG